MQLRARGLSSPSYSPEEKLFTIKLHHGGKLIEHPLKMYVGGRVDFVDFIDPDLMSLIELDKFAEKLGYVSAAYYYYLIPGRNVQSSLVFLLCDDDVLKMGSIGVQFGEVSVYIVEPSFMGLLEDVIDRDIQTAYQCDNEGGGSGNKEKECDNAEGGDSEFKGEKSDNAEAGDSETETDTTDEFDLCDSDYDLSEEDDILYDTHVDPEIEILAKEMDSSNIRSKGKQNDTEFHQKLFDDVEMGMGVHLESDSDCESSADELQSLCSDDEENEGGTKYIRFNPKTDMENPQFRIGMVFTSPDEFKQAVRSHAVHWQRDIVFLKNDKRRVRAKCKGTKCPWVALASKMKNSPTFQIRTLNVKHKCGRTLSKNKFVTSKLLSQKYKNDWRLNNGWRVGDFQEKVHNDLNCEISRSQYYRTKRKVNDMINGHHKDQYARLWDYTEELKRSNPNSTVVLKTDVDAKTGEEKFMRLYICFDACKRGFMEACRPVIGVDGCHLKGTHKGVILTALGLDPNNCIFPICFCVVEGEHKKSWEWFLELLVQDVGIIDQQKWTFISDRQKGLMPALYELLPDIEHRFCVMHMYNNFKKQHPGLALKDRFCNLTRATTVNQFRFQMDSLKDFDEGAHKWISEVLPKHWSRSNFRTSPKCDILLNNICESFNAAILEARGNPLLSMVESIRVYLMKRFQSKRQLMGKWIESICPKILKRMEKLKDNTRSCISTYAGAAKFEVRDMYGQYSVNIQQKSCSCRRWDLCGIPCSHGMSAIMSAQREPEEYVDLYYSVNTYHRAYAYVINPVNGPSEWPNAGKGPIAPPGDIKLPGRPKGKRRREVGEPPAAANGTTWLGRSYQKTVNCKRCGVSGHNKAKCTGSAPPPDDAPQPKAPPTAAQSDPTPKASAQPSQPQADHIATTQPAPNVKKRRCSVCLQEGHYRSKCPTPAGRIWRNYDRYAFNFQHNPVSEEPNAPPAALRSSGSESVSEGARRGVSERVSEGASSSIGGANRSANIGGVSVETAFVKKGKHCVTLKSLQTAAKSRSVKEPFTNIGQLTQQSSSTAKTNSKKKKN
ncbi:hypothetical protein BUALT_Bualt13G0091400 [Buddleja alternifolia]|uniref:SWIM-type domain-containing protein n=1 Tax=Buddleja alternifolia TaxID=168488 RepID=A0AAV6WX02_9LAMI|nr:hypothetical protein BUALT_Bualt13G0091400 [Buddleja alternifolia]